MVCSIQIVNCAQSRWRALFKLNGELVQEEDFSISLCFSSTIFNGSSEFPYYRVVNPDFPLESKPATGNEHHERDEITAKLIIPIIGMAQDTLRELVEFAQDLVLELSGQSLTTLNTLLEHVHVGHSVIADRTFQCQS